MTVSRTRQLEDALAQLVHRHGQRGGELDKLLPPEEQRPEIAAAMRLLPMGQAEETT